MVPEFTIQAAYIYLKVLRNVLASKFSSHMSAIKETADGNKASIAVQKKAVWEFL